jgi:hypothetical protein
MIGVGIAANLTEFMLTKIIGRKIEISFDQKRQAVRAFLDLFESLSCLERALPKLIQETQKVVGGSAKRLFGAPWDP